MCEMEPFYGLKTSSSPESQDQSVKHCPRGGGYDYRWRWKSFQSVIWVHFIIKPYIINVLSRLTKGLFL